MGNSIFRQNKKFSIFFKGKTLLDIGCGAGIFMDYARDQGYKCTGIEPSKMASKIAQEKNLKVLNCDMDYFLKIILIYMI